MAWGGGLWLGRRVRIAGLSARPELNGWCGVAASYDGERYDVTLEGDGKGVRVRAANLRAAEAGNPAACEAADARYAWLEAMSLGDALKWCGASEAQGIRKRLRGVAARLSASLKELGLDDL